MSPILTLAIILVIAFALILTNRLRADVGALGIALALGLTGLITPLQHDSAVGNRRQTDLDSGEY